jgi:signal transduction histidine kinase
VLSPSVIETILRSRAMAPSRRFVDYLGAHNVPDRAKHERDRALWRAVLGMAVASFWLGQHLVGREVQASPWFAVFLGLVMPALALVYRRFLAANPQGGVAAQYAFLILDPVAIVGTLLQDPRSFAFLHPVMMIVLVGIGIRFGVRTMHFTFGITLALCTLLATSPFWRADLALTSSFLLSLAFVPLFFSSLVRRLHSDRAIEEERARATAAHELALARSAFLAKVSHELRSPLQGIVSALDVIEMRHARALAGDEELIGRMRRSSMLLNTQLRDLLTLAKGEAGRLAIHAEPFEACALVEAMAEAARDLAVAKGLRLQVVLPPPPLFAVADAARIDQVLTNLVVNSIRYTDAGEVRIAMEAVGSPPRGLRFVVSDTGPGIPEDVLPTLLEPDRSVTTSARRGEGSGIGLAIVRTLVEHLGGTLRVTSALGQGTTFSVEIPAEFEPPDTQK